MYYDLKNLLYSWRHVMDKFMLYQLKAVLSAENCYVKKDKRSKNLGDHASECIENFKIHLLKVHKFSNGLNLAIFC